VVCAKSEGAQVAGQRAMRAAGRRVGDGMGWMGIHTNFADAWSLERLQKKPRRRVLVLLTDSRGHRHLPADPIARAEAERPLLTL
jgi:hypothetical protein